MSKPIVVGIDETPASQVALDWAISEAIQRALPLVVLHVGEVAACPAVGPVLARTRGQEMAAKALVRARNRNILASSIVIPGNPADVLTSWATDASMIVLGSRGQSTVSTAIHGSVGSSVAARAQCPVIVVRVEPPSRAAVVVGVDGSPTSRAAVEFAFDHAARHGTWVRAVHAWHRGVLHSDLTAERAAHQRVLDDAVAGMRARYPTVPVHVIRTIGRPEEILAEESMLAELLVVGTRGHGFASGLLLGSVSQALLRSASCPLAVIPTQDG